MYTLGLDEYGDFEGLTGINDAIMVGGVIYDDAGDRDDCKNERKRIEAYYRTVIKDAGKTVGYDLKYPRALHVTGNSEKSLKEVAAVKGFIEKTLKEFLCKGTYNGAALVLEKGTNKKTLPERVGRYYIYAVLKSDRGKQEQIKEHVKKHAEILLDDNYASNLYFHMVAEVLDRCVFHTHYAGKGAAYALEIATRSTGILERGCELAQQYKALAYEGSKYKRTYSKDKTVGGEKEDLLTADGKPGIIYTLTNGDVYRSAISQKIMDDNPENVSIDSFKVESISYGQENGNQEFLFLADSVCSVLTFRLNQGRDSADEWLDELEHRMNRLIDVPGQLLFGYDSADNGLSEVLKRYHQGDYYGTLREICQAQEDTTAFGRFYSKKWFRLIEENIIKSEDLGTFGRAVQQLYDSQKSNTYDQKTGLYIFHVLEQQAETVKNHMKVTESKKVLFTLYECGMVAYCHMGNSEKAEAYYNRMSDYAGSATVEEIIRTRNMMSVYFCDNIEFKKACTYAKENVKDSHLLGKVRKRIVGMEDLGGALEEAKAWSQLGQGYAFLRDERAEKCFEKALRLFDTKSANYFITSSYLMHYYLDCGMLEKYDVLAKDYFGNRTDDLERLRYIFEEKKKQDPLIHTGFALYLLVKELYIKGVSCISENCWDALKNLEEYANQNFLSTSSVKYAFRGHPSELILKYLILIAIERKDVETELFYRDKLEAQLSEKNGPTINAIIFKGLLDIAVCHNDEYAQVEFCEKVISSLEGMAVFRSAASWKYEKQKKKIDETFVFMYN